jgi:urocanate hydratase
MNGGVALCIDVDPARIERRVKTRYLDRETDDLDTALGWVAEARSGGEAVSIGLLGNCADVEPELLRRGWRPDIVTDQTSAHDPLGGYVPAGLTLQEAAALRASDPDEYQRHAYKSMADHVAAMVGFLDAGAVVFDYGNNLRAGAELGGMPHDLVMQALSLWGQHVIPHFKGAYQATSDRIAIDASDGPEPILNSR